MKGLGGNNMLHIILALSNARDQVAEGTACLRFRQSCLSMTVNPNANKQEKEQAEMKAVIKEQIDVIARLVKGGERLREKTKQAEMEKEDAAVEVAELRTEIKSVQRYAEVIEERFKERARAEEEGNKKVLALIDAVERLEAERLQLMDA